VPRNESPSGTATEYGTATCEFGGMVIRVACGVIHDAFERGDEPGSS
jgi:hypothetical protein